MISVTEHIRYLLTCHECVIVPGWGAFVSQYVGARLSGSGSEILAPTRVLGFNADVAHNDGLLAAGISRREGISYDAAVALIANEVSMFFHRVDVLGELTMPRIGRFFKESNGALTFEPDSDNPIVAADYMGLPDVPVTPIATQNTGNTFGILPVEPRRRNITPLKIAASVAVLLCMGTLFSTPVLVDKNAIDYASMATEVKVPKVQETAVREISSPVDSTLHFAIPAADSIGASIKVVSAAKAEPRCYLVIASCETRRRAEKYIASSPEQGLRILERDGRFRVYIATGNNAAEAFRLNNENADFARRHPDAWVYSR